MYVIISNANFGTPFGWFNWCIQKGKKVHYSFLILVLVAKDQFEDNIW